MLRRPFLAVLPALLMLTLAACGSNGPTSPSVGLNVPFSSTDLIVGTGTEATSGRLVRVHYTGWLYDGGKTDNKGVQFDSSIGGASFAFQLGLGQVIAGWDQGVRGMRVGGTRRLVIPPSLGYGASGSGPIPGNATLVFDIELIAVQ